MKVLKTTLILICLCFSLKAQVSVSNKRIADVYFQNKEYYAAAEYYKKMLQISPDSLGFKVPYSFETRIKETKLKKDDYEYAVFQLATSLRLYKNFTDAEKWYAIATQFSNPKYETSGFWYGECLRANLKYEEAISALEQFLKNHKNKDELAQKARAEIESCKFAMNEMKYPKMFRISKLPNTLNGEGSNYAPVYDKSNFYFTSSRPLEEAGKNQVLDRGKGVVKIMKKESPYINTLYTVTDNNPKNENVSFKKLSIDVKKMEFAANTIHPNGDFMLLTGWVDKDDKKKSILISRKINGEWTEPRSIGGEINVNGFNSIQPSITRDGKYLLFASDRPGGYGGYDLWYALLRPDGSVGNAVNFGAKINSKDDEQAPYYQIGRKALIFSSNGRIGLGGFDFYESEGDFVNWDEPANMGYPFNSAKDDLYFTAIDDEGKEGYISSDRESLCCLELFYFARDYININGRLVDCVSNKPVEGASVTLKIGDMLQKTVLSDANGNYRFKINDNRGLQINISKDKFFAKNVVYNYNQLLQVDTLLSINSCLDPIIINKPIVLNNIFYEFNSAELTLQSKNTLDTLYQLMIDNPKIDIELSAHTDNIGTAEYNLGLSDRRAKSCVNYLVERGINQDRMTWKGYGFTKPVAPNQLPNGKDNPEGRALNRRTEFKVTKQN